MIETRRATPLDVDAILAHVQAGFDSYSEFAPAGWTSPDVGPQRAATTERLAQPETWALLALVEDEPVGHVSFYPARERTPRQGPGSWHQQPVVPGTAHLWQLFVLRQWWGRGVAPLLHDAAVDEMHRQGYAAARLFTPTDHERAKRFYERRGWRATRLEFNPGLALMLTEYRLELHR